MIEDFWLNVRFDGQSINEKYAGEAIEDRRARAARAFELWREGRFTIDYDHNCLVRCVEGDSIRIVAPHFTAGVVLDDTGRVTRAAPILRYMLGWNAARVLDYAARKQWRPQRLARSAEVQSPPP